jgi:hypothetical protein
MRPTMKPWVHKQAEQRQKQNDHPTDGKSAIESKQCPLRFSHSKQKARLSAGFSNRRYRTQLTVEP